MSTNTSSNRTIYVGTFVAFAVLATSVALLRVYYLRRLRRVNVRRVPQFVPQYPTRPSYQPYIPPPAPPYNPPRPPYSPPQSPYNPPRSPYFPPYTPPNPYFPPSPSPSYNRVPKAKVNEPRRNPRNNMDGHDEPRPDAHADGQGPRQTIPTPAPPNDRREPAQPNNPVPDGSGPPPAYDMDGRD